MGDVQVSFGQGTSEKKRYQDQFSAIFDQEPSIYSQRQAYRNAEEESKKYRSESESHGAIISILNDPAISY